MFDLQRQWIFKLNLTQKRLKNSVKLNLQYVIATVKCAYQEDEFFHPLFLCSKKIFIFAVDKKLCSVQKRRVFCTLAYYLRAVSKSRFRRHAVVKKLFDNKFILDSDKITVTWHPLEKQILRVADGNIFLIKRQA